MLAKLLFLVAFAVTTDAFQSVSLRTLHHQTKKFNSHTERLDFLNLRQHKTSLAPLKNLRAAGTLYSEKVYQVAQARNASNVVLSPQAS